MKKRNLISLTYCLIIISIQLQAQNLKLNQIGFYPQSEKTAIVPNGRIGSSFHVVDEMSKDTVFNGIVNARKYWDSSEEQVSQADFSAINVPGTYSLKIGNSQESHVFEIKNTPYQDLLKASIKAYYFQRCSSPLLVEHAGIYNRNLGHPDDRIIVHSSAASPERPAGTILSMPKGWYDAGDYNKYIVNSGISTYTLLAAFEHFESTLNELELNIPESGNNVPDVLDEIKWNLDWMLTMQDPNDGGVYHKLSFKNFSGYELPENAAFDRYVVQKTTTASFDFAAVMAQASRIFKAFESNFPGFADQCYEASLQAWKWGRSNPNIIYQQPSDIKTGEYGDGNLKDERQWAAAELYITTNADSFYIATEVPSINASVPSWQSVNMLALLSLAKHRSNLTDLADNAMVKTKVLDLADQLFETYQSSAYRIAMGGTKSDFVWGSNGLAANQSLILLSAFELTNDGKYFAAAHSNLDYLLGRNPLNFSYVTGYGDNSTLNPHHRVSISDKISEPVPGLLAGGPNPGQQDGCNYTSNLPALSYVDDKCSYASNEIAINWNAPLVFTTAGITHALRQSTDASPFIIAQPDTHLAIENESTLLSIKAAGMEPISYQWIKNDEEMIEANSATLKIPNTSSSDETDVYKVRISNEKGSIESDPIRIKIVAKDILTSLNDNDDLSSIYFSPNPTKDKKVYFKSPVKNIQIVITSTTGHQSRPIIQPDNSIDLAYLSKGIYFIHLMTRDSSKITTKKIVLD